MTFIIEPRNLEKHLNKLVTKFNDKQFKFDVREESETDFFVKNIKKELKQEKIDLGESDITITEEEKDFIQINKEFSFTILQSL